MAKGSPRQRHTPHLAKQARSVPASSLSETPEWSFREVDLGGPWCFGKMTGDDVRMLLGRLREFETMRWHEIEGRDHHSIKCNSIISDAQRRLGEIGKDDEDSLFSFAIAGKPRLWGIRRGRAFCLLWWDPEHAVKPAPLKHT